MCLQGERLTLSSHALHRTTAHASFSPARSSAVKAVVHCICLSIKIGTSYRFGDLLRLTHACIHLFAQLKVRNRS